MAAFCYYLGRSLAAERSDMSEPIWLKVGPLRHYHGPEWLKQAWEGCILPCEEQKETTLIHPRGIMPRDYEQPQRDPANPDELLEIPGYCVRQDAALKILERKLPAAAQWYRDKLCPEPDGYFLFEKRDVEVVESATPAAQFLH